MAILTVTVYKINGEYFPGGCEKEISCGKFLSLKSNVTLEIPVAPLTCDEDQPEPVTTEIIVFPNGEKWWIEFNGTSIIQQCAAASITGFTTLNIGDGSVQDVPNTLQINNGGETFFVDSEGVVTQIGSASGQKIRENILLYKFS